jgi:hypothetical protein
MTKTPNSQHSYRGLDNSPGYFFRSIRHSGL